MNVLVTGASGFLGSHVVELLSERGDEVRAFVRATSSRRYLRNLPNVELFDGTVQEEERLVQAMRGVDAVVHCAGQVKARTPADFFAVNVGGTTNVVNAARRSKNVRRLVYVSSLEACGPSSDGSPVSPVQLEPVTAYGRSKVAAERVLSGAKGELSIVVLRPSLIYGPRDDKILGVFKAIKLGLLPLMRGGRARAPWV